MRLIFLATLVMAGCGPLKEAAEDLLDGRTPREKYEAALVNSGLARTALATDWTSAADRALRDAPLVNAAHSEEGFFHPGEPVAIAYRMQLRRGQKLTFAVDLAGDSLASLFVDAFEVGGEGERTFRRIAVADSGMRSVTFGPRRDGEFVVRAQPELLRGGKFVATVRILPTLAFPVQNGKESDVGSRFGDDRDGGRRSHHGIDIFAPRGTPVLAAAPGRIQRVQTTEVGGNVVWMRDTLGNRLYYAHLDRQNVEANQDVQLGDTIGFVGNTGNARTTPPHLHFGVYSRGPVDPWYFVYTPRSRVAPLVVDAELLGKWSRTNRDATVLRASPESGADSIAILPEQTALRVVSAVGSYFRVRLPDGATGYVNAASVESLTRALLSTETTVATLVKARPSFASVPGDALAHLTPGEAVAVLGRFGNFTLVRAGKVTGWVPIQETAEGVDVGGNNGAQR